MFEFHFDCNERMRDQIPHFSLFFLTLIFFFLFQFSSPFLLKAKVMKKCLLVQDKWAFFTFHFTQTNTKKNCERRQLGFSKKIFIFLMSFVSLNDFYKYHHFLSFSSFRFFLKKILYVFALQPTYIFFHLFYLNLICVFYFFLLAITSSFPYFFLLSKILFRVSKKQSNKSSLLFTSSLDLRKYFF